MASSTHNDWNTLYGVCRGCHAVDRMTDTVFFSDLLPARCPELYRSLDKILSERNIDHRLLTNTRDIWCRDYMPVQTDWRRFVFYRYDPDYLHEPRYRKTLTDVDRVGNIDSLRQGEVHNLDLVLDGGNVVKCGDKIIMTEKVFFENRDKSRQEVVRLLEEAFQCGIVFLPWDRREPFGHSDGIVHDAGDNRVLMTNYADFDASMARIFIKALDNFVEVVPLEYKVRKKHARSWAYINFLQIGRLVLVPQLGMAEDEQALRQISEALPGCEVVGVPALEAVRRGGALNCLSWNVSANWWHEGFMGEAYKVHNRSVGQIRQSAEKGRPRSQCDLGCCYFYGIGVGQDIQEGNRWYEKAAAQGLPQAQFNLGMSYFKGEGLPKDPTKALQLFRQSSSGGDADAQLFVAYCLEDLHAPVAEVTEAYRKSAEMGNADACCFMGESYSEGENGLPKEEQEACRWYRKAAASGSGEAQYQLGLRYDCGIGVRQSRKEAAGWYRKSASKNHSGGLFMSGCCYYYGSGVRMNDSWALKCFRRAVAAGHPGARYMIGNLYLDGCAVERDAAEAVKWYRLAAADNYIPAFYKLGYCLYEGIGLPENRREALRYFQQAAEGNDAYAYCMIGDYYRKGYVVEQDEEEAVKYYKKSIELGCRKAEKKLHDLLWEKEGREGERQEDA